MITDRTRPLKRGKACFNCRHLKIKCDGQRPMCGPCIRVQKDDPCEYPDTMSRTQELQETVHRLQSRIEELQAGPSRNFGSPYPSFSARASPFSERSAGSGPSYLSEDVGTFEEPPFPMVQLLLRSFLAHAPQFGFFLDPQRFHDAALLPLPLGDPLRPAPALLCVVYLWGVHLAKIQPLLSAEPVFLRRAQHYLATALSPAAAASSNTILHTIQAQILLGTYLFRTNRLLEAEVHANGAATLALRYGLHRIRSARPASPSLSPVSAASSPSLPHPADTLEEGERIRAFWALAALQVHLCVALPGPASAFCVLENAAEIDTPWPLGLADYAAGALHPHYRGEGTVRHLMSEDTFPPGVPTSVLLAKASVLMFRAIRVAGTANSPPQARTHLETRIAQFWQSLPPTSTAYYAADSNAARSLAFVHVLIAGAAMRLYSSSPQAQAESGKCVLAARSVLQILTSSNTNAGVGAGGDSATVHPVVGSVAAAACKVLIAELRGGGGGHAQRDAYTRELNAGMAAMQGLAAESPFVDYQLQKVKRDWEGVGIGSGRAV
ncbi:hypothetical protein MKEN_00200800 [Mycena kentingensis (nom. inval.)]|nr:hypothetical protein MKEN_00200800 [Mycena kentingensis (nom. inval.)]